MPTYEYRCLECEIKFERFQSMKDEPISECPECKGKVKRLIGTGAGIIFKGEGFYETDYRSKSYKKAAEIDAKSAKTDVDKKNDKKENATTRADSTKTTV